MNPTKLRLLLAANRYRPLRWPVKVPGRFPAECLLCGTHVYVAVGPLTRDLAERGGRRREYCAHVRRSLVSPPDLPDTKRVDREPLARKLLDDHCYRPLGPYPGFMNSEWAAKCLMCGAEVWVAPANLASRPVRNSCAHRLNKTITPAPARIVRARELTDEMKRKARP